MILFFKVFVCVAQDDAVILFLGGVFYAASDGRPERVGDVCENEGEGVGLVEAKTRAKHVGDVP